MKTLISECTCRKCLVSLCLLYFKIKVQIFNQYMDHCCDHKKCLSDLDLFAVSCFVLTPTLAVRPTFTLKLNLSRPLCTSFSNELNFTKFSTLFPGVSRPNSSDIHPLTYLHMHTSSAANLPPPNDHMDRALRNAPTGLHSRTAPSPLETPPKLGFLRYQRSSFSPHVIHDPTVNASRACRAQARDFSIDATMDDDTSEVH